jgi:hypothetical protein
MFSAAEPRETKTVSVSSVLYFGDEAVVAAGELAEVLVGGFEELQNRLGEVVAAGDDALHVVFLVLDGAEEDGVGEVHHLGDAAAGGSEEVRWASVGQSMMSSGAPRYSRIRSDSCL